MQIRTQEGAGVFDAKRIYELVPQFGRLREEFLVGDVWEQPELSKRDRSLVTCAVLAALAHTDELEIHFSRALENGVSKEEIRGLIVQVALYAGWPCGVKAGKVALPYLEDEDRKP